MTREEAAKILNRFFSSVILPRCSGKQALKEAIDMAFEALKEEPRKTARWILNSFPGSGEYVCSNCQRLEYFPSEAAKNEYKYCRYCGAKMEEEE